MSEGLSFSDPLGEQSTILKDTALHINKKLKATLPYQYENCCKLHSSYSLSQIGEIQIFRIPNSELRIPNLSQPRCI